MGLYHHDDGVICDKTNTGLMNAYVISYRKYSDLTDDDKCQYMKLYCPTKIVTSVDNEEIKVIKDVNLFPNPAKNSVVLEVASQFFNSDFDLYIIDQIGVKQNNIKFIKFDKSDKFYIDIDVSSLLPGIYFISLNGYDTVATLKFIVKRD